MALADWPWLEFLERLRRRLWPLLFLFASASVGGWIYAPWVTAHLTGDPPIVPGLVVLAPAEAFVTRLKMAVALGFAVCLPLFLWQARSIVKPALGPKARRATLALVPVASLLFYAGVLLATEGILPLALTFLLQFAGDELTPMIRMASFVDLVLIFGLVFGMIFQLPVAIFVLASAGAISVAALQKTRRAAWLSFFIIGALLTPADPFSQLAMAIPLTLLYEISILLARLMAARRAAPDRSEAGEEGAADGA